MLLSMGLQRVRHYWVTKHTHTTSEASWALESQGGNILESRHKKTKEKQDVLVWMHTFFLKLHLANNCIFYRLRDWGFIAILHWAILLTPFFSSVFSHFLSLSHILVVLAIFQTFSLLLYLLWWSLIIDTPIVIVLGNHKLPMYDIHKIYIYIYMRYIIYMRYKW